MQTQYGFDPDTLQYYSIGRDGRRRVIPTSSVAKDATRFSVATRIQMRNYARQLIAGAIPLQKFYDDMRREMKLSYYATVAAARGKSPDDSLTAAELAFLIYLLTRQFNYLDDFITDIEVGAVALNGSLVNRAGMYGVEAKSIFENWRLWQATIGGWTECRRVLGFAEHCQDSNDRPGCIELADQGWIPIAEMTPLGEATCLSNCQCTMEFRERLSIASGDPGPDVIQFESKPVIIREDVMGPDNIKRSIILFKYDPNKREVEIKHHLMKKPKKINLSDYE